MQRTLQEGEDGYDASGADVDGELVLPDRELLHELGQAAHHPRPVSVHGVGLGSVLIARVDDGCLQRTHGVAAKLPRVGGILRDGDDVLRRGNGEATDGGAVGGGRRRPCWLQGRGQSSASTDPAGHFRERMSRRGQLVVGGGGVALLLGYESEYFGDGGMDDVRLRERITICGMVLAGEMLVTGY